MPSVIPANTFLGVYEMVLEVADLAEAERFYAGILGLPVADRWGPPRSAVWLGIGGGGFLGLWPRESGGEVAIHAGRGGKHVHFALRVQRGSLQTLALALEAAGYDVEWRHFDQGNVALYVTDPDGNCVELTELRVRWDGTAVDGG